MKHRRIHRFFGFAFLVAPVHDFSCATGSPETDHKVLDDLIAHGSRSSLVPDDSLKYSVSIPSESWILKDNGIAKHPMQTAPRKHVPRISKRHRRALTDSKKSKSPKSPSKKERSKSKSSKSKKMMSSTKASSGGKSSKVSRDNIFVKKDGKKQETDGIAQEQMSSKNSTNAPSPSPTSSRSQDLWEPSTAVVIKYDEVTDSNSSSSWSMSAVQADQSLVHNDVISTAASSKVLDIPTKLLVLVISVCALSILI